MPPEILNPLLALGVLLLVAGLAVVIIYSGEAMHTQRSGTANQSGSTTLRREVRAQKRNRVVRPERVGGATKEPQILAIRQWIDRANNQPDRSPHLAFIGPSGSGKSTLMLATLHERPGRMIIITPKNAQDDPWGGFPAVRLAADGKTISFEPLKAAILSVYSEMIRRSALGFDPNDWLTLVIDEFSTVIGKFPELKEVILDILTLGRSTRIRLIIGAVESNVKAWGWEGRGEARNSVLFIECDLDEETEQRTAIMYRWGKEKQAPQLDTRNAKRLADQPFRAVQWEPELSSVSDTNTATDDSLVEQATVTHPRKRTNELAATSEEIVWLRRHLETIQSDGQNQNTFVVGADNALSEQADDALPALTGQKSDEQSNIQSSIAPRDRDALIRFLVRSGWGANDITKTIKGDNSMLYPLIRQIAEEEGIAQNT